MNAIVLFACLRIPLMYPLPKKLEGSILFMKYIFIIFASYSDEQNMELTIFKDRNHISLFSII